ncbi:hypothetical protein [Escherichia coli IS29]|nr:hypothetical protein [Escherichia coli IS29]
MEEPVERAASATPALIPLPQLAAICGIWNRTKTEMTVSNKAEIEPVIDE